MCRYHHPTMPGAGKMYSPYASTGPGGFGCPCCQNWTKEETRRRTRRKMKIEDKELMKVLDETS